MALKMQFFFWVYDGMALKFGFLSDLQWCSSGNMNLFYTNVVVLKTMISFCSHWSSNEQVFLLSMQWHIVPNDVPF